MNAPDRRTQVRSIINSYGNYLLCLNTEADDRRRRLLRPVCEQLNLIDNGKWGVLLKTDKNPDYIPVDVIVWLDTLEHIDISTTKDIVGTSNVSIQPVWVNHGKVPKPEWKWLAIENSGIPEIDDPITPIPPVTPPTGPVTPKPPVDYNTFVTKESWEVRDTYLAKRGHEPAISDMYHNAWRRLVEGWSHEKILKDI